MVSDYFTSDATKNAKLEGVLVSKITLFGFIAIGIDVLVTEPTAAHSVKHGDTVINYEELLGGNGEKTECCNGSHCQPA